MTDEPNPSEPAKPTVDRIREGAAELFSERGYGGTTTRALSAVAGIEKASLYHHVGGKEDLLYELCESTLKDVATVFHGALQDGRLHSTRLSCSPAATSRRRSSTARGTRPC